MSNLTKTKSAINSMHSSVTRQVSQIFATRFVRPTDESKVTKSAKHIHSVIMSMVMSPTHTYRLMRCKIRCSGIQIRDISVQTLSTSIHVLPFV